MKQAERFSVAWNVIEILAETEAVLSDVKAAFTFTPALNGNTQRDKSFVR